MYTPPSILPDYAELQCMSHYTFLQGASAPEQLVDRAAELGYRAITIADECTLAGVVKAHLAAKARGIHLIIGAQMTITPPGGVAPFRILVLAMTRDGYGNLCELITAARMRSEKGSYLVHSADIDSPAADLQHIVGLPNCQLILLPGYCESSTALAPAARWLSSVAPGRARIAMTLHHRSDDDAHKDTVLAVAREVGLAVVATGDVCMHLRSYKPVQDVMTAIRLRTPVAQCGFSLAPNAEQHLRGRLRLGNLYTRAQLDETVAVAKLCTFSLDELRYEYPTDVVPDGETASSYLRKETYVGAHWRYPQGIPENVQTLVEKELTLIQELAYENYFLTVYEIVRFARANKILCQGRGSAANSAVCFCLGITEVDPARGTLFFERFISSARDSPPDIDLDIENQRREEIFQHVYRRYGRQRAALTAVVTSYRPRSVLRDVAAALGIDSSIADKVAKAGHRWGATEDLRDRIAQCGLDPDSPVATMWVRLAEHMMTYPRHLSQHPGGFVLSRGKLSRLVPIENARMEDRSIIQWDKDDLDAVGLLKVDLLALGMLTCIRRALQFVSDRRGEPFELQDIPAEDPETYAMLSRAESVGTFQVESRAQMALLPHMRPQCFYDLVIQIALIRPGPLQGGMVHPYLRRRDGIEPVTYPSPEMEAILARTLGVPIFQEQVMQISMVAAGFSADEADQLRRAMAAWKRKGGLEAFDAKLMEGMAARGYSEQFAASIVSQIRGFSEYGFPESHSASFALIAYASSWLKCHEPAAFLAALLNSQPMGFYRPSQLVQDARRNGVMVLPVDIAVSSWEAALEYSGAAEPAVRLGLNSIIGLERDAAWRIEEARGASTFVSMNDVALRARLDASTLRLLASASAFAAMNGNRRESVWSAAGSAPGKGLLRGAVIEEEPLQLPAPTEAEELVADYEHLGLTLGRHPIAMLRDRLHKMRFTAAADLAGFSDSQLARGCGLVTVRQRPQTANGVVFLTLEDETGNTNVIVWPSLAESQRHEVMSATLLGVYGQWQEKNNVGHLVAKRLVDLSHLLGQLDTRSRDFH